MTAPADTTPRGPAARGPDTAGRATARRRAPPPASGWRCGTGSGCCCCSSSPGSIIVWASMADNPLLPFADAVRIQARDVAVAALAGRRRGAAPAALPGQRALAPATTASGRSGCSAASSAASHRRFSDWTRFRLARLLKLAFFVVLFALVAGAGPGDHRRCWRCSQAPALLWSGAAARSLQLAFAFFFIAFQFIGLFWLLSRGGVDTYYPDDIKTRFSDVWGQDHVLDAGQGEHRLPGEPGGDRGQGRLRARRGMLLWGPPGTGKTLMAEAVAGETGKPYVFVDPGAFTNMFMGVGILKVKSLFRKLRKLALRYGGVIVFFDEADALGNRGALAQGGPGGGARGMTPAPFQAAGCHGFSYLSDGHAVAAGPPGDAARRRASAPDDRRSRFMMGGMGGGGGGGMGTLQALLTELSGLKKPRGLHQPLVPAGARACGPKPPPKYRILVMMATNMPEALDEALLRPGRIDRIYKVGYPSKAGRVRTYEGYLDKVTHELDRRADRQARHDHPVRHRRHDQGPGQRGADHRDPGRPGHHHLADVHPGQAAQGARPAGGRRVHRARAARRGRARGLPRRGRLPHPAAHGDRHRDDREGQRLPRHGRQHPAGGPVHPVAHGVRGATSSSRWRRWPVSGCSSTATARPGVSGDLESATAVASLMEGYWGMGSTVSSYSTARRLGGRQPRRRRAAAEGREHRGRDAPRRWPTGSRTTSPTCWSGPRRS